MPTPKFERKVAGLFADPRVKSVHIFDENLVGIEMTKSRILFSRPIISGVAVLELSKAYMVEMVHDVIMAQGTPLLCYSDTDSIYVKFEGCEGTELIKRRPEMFDTSAFKEGNACGVIPQNRKVSGLLAVEKADSTVLSFIYLRPKAYCVLMEAEGGEKFDIKRGKGATKAVIKGFTFSDYVEVLRSGKKVMSKMVRILSRRHKIFTLEYNKTALRALCTKRHFLPSGESLPYGHKSLNNVEYPFVEE